MANVNVIHYYYRPYLQVFVTGCVWQSNRMPNNANWRLCFRHSKVSMQNLDCLVRWFKKIPMAYSAANAHSDETNIFCQYFHNPRLKISVITWHVPCEVFTMFLYSSIYLATLYISEKMVNYTPRDGSAWCILKLDLLARGQSLEGYKPCGKHSFHLCNILLFRMT